MERGGDLDVGFLSGTWSDADSDDLVALGDAIAAAHDVADAGESIGAESRVERRQEGAVRAQVNADGAAEPGSETGNGHVVVPIAVDVPEIRPLGPVTTHMARGVAESKAGPRARIHQSRADALEIDEEVPLPVAVHVPHLARAMRIG